MPEIAAVGDMYQLRLVGSLEGQQTNNILNFTNVGAASDVLDSLVTTFIACFQDNLLPVMASGFTFESVHWKRTHPTLGPEFVEIPTGTVVGGGNAAALPSYCSAVISLRTSLGGPSHRGRMYVPAIPENQTTNSNLDPALPFYLGLVAFCVCMAGAFIHPDPAGGSDLWDVGVYSRLIGGSAFPYGTSGFTAVSQLQAHRELGTTRSRKVGHGV